MRFKGSFGGMRKYQSLMVAVLSAKQWSLWLSASEDLAWFEPQLSDWHIFKRLVRILVKNADNEPSVLVMNTVHEIIWELLRAGTSERKLPVFSFQTLTLLLWLMETPFGRRPLQKETLLPGASGENHNSFLICHHSSARDFEWLLAGMNWLNQEIYPLPTLPSFFAIMFYLMFPNFRSRNICERENSKPLNSLMFSLQPFRPFFSFYPSLLFIPMYASVLLSSGNENWTTLS